MAGRESSFSLWNVSELSVDLSFFVAASNKEKKLSPFLTDVSIKFPTLFVPKLQKITQKTREDMAKVLGRPIPDPQNAERMIMEQCGFNSLFSPQTLWLTLFFVNQQQLLPTRRTNLLRLHRTTSRSLFLSRFWRKWRRIHFSRTLLRQFIPTSWSGQPGEME